MGATARTIPAAGRTTSATRTQDLVKTRTTGDCRWRFVLDTRGETPTNIRSFPHVVVRARDPETAVEATHSVDVTEGKGGPDLVHDLQGRDVEHQDAAGFPGAQGSVFVPDGLVAASHVEVVVVLGEAVVQACAGVDEVATPGAVQAEQVLGRRHEEKFRRGPEERVVKHEGLRVVAVNVQRFSSAVGGAALSDGQRRDALRVVLIARIVAPLTSGAPARLP